jgi:hypothetical protein
LFPQTPNTTQPILYFLKKKKKKKKAKRGFVLIGDPILAIVGASDQSCRCMSKFRL